MANKESMDVIAFLEGLARAISEADEDGNINLKDIGLAPEVGVLATSAVVGSSGIIKEIKGMNGEELNELLHASVSAVTDLIAAVASAMATGGK